MPSDGRTHREAATVVSARWITGPIENEWTDPAHIPPGTTGRVTRARDHTHTFPYDVLFDDGTELAVYAEDIRSAEESPT